MLGGSQILDGCLAFLLLLSGLFVEFLYFDPGVADVELLAAVAGQLASCLGCLALGGHFGLVLCFVLLIVGHSHADPPGTLGLALTLPQLPLLVGIRLGLLVL